MARCARPEAIAHVAKRLRTRAEGDMRRQGVPKKNLAVQFSLRLKTAGTTWR